MNRRSVLAWFGSGLVVIGLGGYHQRRRLRRWPDRDALHAAQEIEYPTVSHPSYLRPTESHLTDALDDLAERVDAARERWPDEEVEADDEEYMANSGRRFERAKATLEDLEEQRRTFEELSAAERLEVLGDLRTALGGAEQAVALADLQRGDRDRDDIITDLEALRDEYETALDDLSYVASSLSWAATAYGELDEWLDNARGSIRMGERYVHGEGTIDTVEPQYSAARAASARARLADADRLRDSLEETARENTTAHSFEQELEDAYERLEERTDTVIEQVEFDIEDGADEVRSHASEISLREYIAVHDGPDDAYEKELLALAVRRKVEHHAYALIHSEFEDAPATQHFDASIPEFDTTGADVRDAKNRAAVAFDDRIRTDGDDPLVRHLCATLVKRLDRQERRLGRHLDAINDDAADEWTVDLERTRLRYREIEELATAIPAAIAAATGNADHA
ncbi:hypothetical protein [Natronobacterium texcoconense]|uniref:Uncharacterized protein n=1 Tax=Natronobacterium texcoconense TaxID=1095778 RepID=A0A1H1AUG1_NATTX|nr:hypothetical protein [Natronobacterium texcoconense]SDQ43292.1 hypothetical protein SAMN04489842_0815 [Natronobacterium texcoconense]